MHQKNTTRTGIFTKGPITSDYKTKWALIQEMGVEIIINMDNLKLNNLSTITFTRQI